MSNTPIANSFAKINSKINQVCFECARKPDSVCLLAVSKTQPLSNIMDAYHLGQRHFAENYLDEAIEKQSNLAFKDVIWHYIGAIQSNKTRKIAQNFDWVHTIDRFKIAQRLNNQRTQEKPPLKVLIQVNISKDLQKSGIVINQVPELAKQISSLECLELKGLMTITAQNLSKQDLCQQFNQLKEMQQQLAIQFPSCTELSMGMSNDFDHAIRNGATMIRLGTRLFGARINTNYE